MGTTGGGAGAKGVTKVSRNPGQFFVLLMLVQRLWKDLTLAILNKDMEAATDAKSAVEDAQREQRKTMEESGRKHVPRFFELRDGRWEPRFTYVAV